MSDYFDANKDEYIDRLFSVSSKGDWSNWIAFCLRGVVKQARDTLSRYERLITLNRDFHEKVRSLGANVRLSQIVDQLFLSPVVRVRLRDPHNVSWTLHARSRASAEQGRGG